MFEQLATKQVKPKDARLIAPTMMDLKLSESDNFTTYTLSKIAQIKIHKSLGIKIPTSNDLYKKEHTMWQQLVQKRLDDARIQEGDQEHFDINSENVRYIICPEQYIIVDVQYGTDTLFDTIPDILEDFMLDISTNRSVYKFFGDSDKGPTKLICYRKGIHVEDEQYVPIVVFELQLNKSIFNCYTGVLITDPYTLLVDIAPVLSTDDFYTFLQYYNLPNFLDIADEKCADLYSEYNISKQNPVELSVREVTSILKKVGYKLQLKSDDEIDEIKDIYDESSNQAIQAFYNTFKFVTGESAYDILRLSDLQKVFRYNKLTLLDLLSILSKEYITPTGGKITASLLSTFIYNMQSYNSMDKGQVDVLKTNISKSNK